MLRFFAYGIATGPIPFVYCSEIGSVKLRQKVRRRFDFGAWSRADVGSDHSPVSKRIQHLRGLVVSSRTVSPKPHRRQSEGQIGVDQRWLHSHLPCVVLLSIPRD